MAEASSAAARPPASRRSRSSPRLAWWLAAAVACVWFLTLDARHLLPTDEGRYAEIAREMSVAGDWVTIRYNGLKYFEKPPLHLWATALAYHLFGIGEWQARLWVAISGAAGLLVTMWAARRWFGPRVGLLSGLALLAAPLWNLGGHLNSLDMSVSGALACVLAGLLLAQHPQADAATRRGWMWFAWAAMAVAVLTKGLIGIVLPGLVLVVYSLLSRDWAVWRRLHLSSGALLMLALSVPWFVLVSLRNPEFAQFFFVHEHWQRYRSTVHGRAGPPWYFVPPLLMGFAPWLGLSWRMAAVARHDARGPGFRPALLLGVWAAVIFVFFSLSSSKLPGYILPVFPALAVLAALALDTLEPPDWGRQLLGLLVLATAALLASPLLARFGSEATPNALFRRYTPWIVAACALAVAGLALARWLNRSGHLLGSIATAALALFAATTVGLLGHETLGRHNSGVDLAARMQAVLTPAMPIYSVRLLDHTLPFYLQRTMVMVEAPGELEFGIRQEPQKWIPTRAGFLAAWTSGAPALAVMSHETYAELRGQHAPMVPIAEDARRVVVANFPGPAP